MPNKLKIFIKALLNQKEILTIIYGSLFILFSDLSLNANPKSNNSFEYYSVSKIQYSVYLSITSTSIMQNLSFGSFCTGSSGGTVIIPSIGSRRTTGSIILIQSDPGFPAILQFMTDNTNFVTLTTGNIVNLTSSSGGSIRLQINDFYPASSFNPIIGQNNVTIGGTLTVGSQAITPAGNYSGSFEVTFNEQ